MGYTENNLMSDEVVIKKAKITMLALIPESIGLGLIALCSIYLMIAAKGASSAVIIGLFLLAFCIILALYLVFRVLKAELSLTNKKILGKVGIIITTAMDAPLNKINNVTVIQSLFGKIFKYGKIVITTSSGNYNYNFVSEPDEFRKLVMNQIDEFDKERVKNQAEQLAQAAKS